MIHDDWYCDSYKTNVAATIKDTHSGEGKPLDNSRGVEDDFVYTSSTVSREFKFGTVKEFKAA